MPKRAEAPFTNYTLYGPVLDRGEGRLKVFLRHRRTKHQTTMSLARYRMSVHLGRRLKRSEEVDHRDEDKTNDNLYNLQILSREENLRKQGATKSTRMAELKCPNCGEIFERPYRQTHLAKRGVFTACSRHCAGRVRMLAYRDGVELWEGNVRRIFHKILKG